MSLALLYFDDGPVRLLAGNRGQIFFDECEISVTCGGVLLATHMLSICYDWSAGPFRIKFDPILHRELFRFIVGRIEAGKIPHLVFHWFEGSEEAIDVTSVVETSVLDTGNLFEILHELPNDKIIRITDIVNPIHVSMLELIAEQLSEGRGPFFDGILFGDGAIVLMEHRADCEKPDGPPTVRSLARSTLESFLEYNQNRWTLMTPLASSRWESEGISLTCGEGGSMGTNGFVAVRDLKDGRLWWAALFQDSSPFKEVTLENGEVVAISANSYRWRFPLDRPELAWVESIAPP